MKRGRSFQNAGPSALRFSGRSRVSTATPSSIEQVSTSEVGRSVVMASSRRASILRRSAGSPKSRQYTASLALRRDDPDPVTPLTTATLEFDEPTWRREQRAAALEVLKVRGMPDPKDDVWKYAPPHELALDDLELATPSDAPRATTIGGPAPAAVVHVSGGQVL